jgi:hypothetical protein
VIDHDVVEPVVAVHDAGAGAGRHPVAQPCGNLLERLQLSGLGSLPLLVPAPDLPLQVTIGSAEVAQSDRGRVEAVQRGERVHQ